MKTHSYLLALLCLFFSCAQEDLTYSDPKETDGFTLSSDVFDHLKIENTLDDLSSEEALSVANLFKKRNSEEITRTGFSGEVKDITPISDKEGNPLMYVVNYTEGFAIVSATKKSTPILAYSEEGSFDSNALAGSSVWLEDTREEII